jgi:hypothetical protein
VREWIAANWNATSGNRWNFPIGGGIGKILKIGDQPINVGLQAFDYVQSAKRWTPVDAPPSGAVPLPAISW